MGTTLLICLAIAAYQAAVTMPVKTETPPQPVPVVASQDATK